MINNFRIFFRVTIISFSVCIMSLLFTPLINFSGSLTEMIFSYAVSLIFWVFFVIALFCYFRTKTLNAVCRKRLIRKKIITDEKEKPGVLCFFENKAAIVFDVLMIVSLPVLIILVLLGSANKWLTISDFVLFLISFEYHCFLNGKTYKNFLLSKEYFKEK